MDNDQDKSSSWKVYTKVKDSLVNGARLENITWRLMALNIKQPSSPKKKNNSSILSKALTNANPSLNTNVQIQETLLEKDYWIHGLLQDSSIPSLSKSFSTSSSCVSESIPASVDSFYVKEEFDSPILTKSTMPRPLYSSSTLLTNPTSIVQTCDNCKTSQTPLWRKNKETGQVLCNACGLFFKLHGTVRPLSLKTDVIRKRNRISKKSQLSLHSEKTQQPVLGQSTSITSSLPSSLPIMHSMKPPSLSHHGHLFTHPPPRIMTSSSMNDIHRPPLKRLREQEPEDLYPSDSTSTFWNMDSASSSIDFGSHLKTRSSSSLDTLAHRNEDSGALLTDVFMMSRVMASEDPLGLGSEALVDSLYGIEDSYDKFSFW